MKDFIVGWTVTIEALLFTQEHSSHCAKADRPETRQLVAAEAETAVQLPPKYPSPDKIIASMLLDEDMG